ncbi:MAG: efflux RND transporter periplasmic adaptor subunit [Negativicutes bacterium]|nr:efflux RND transporter periplasmic adaptor subunit [Negativicutes bacterium]
MSRKKAAIVVLLLGLVLMGSAGGWYWWSKRQKAGEGSEVNTVAVRRGPIAAVVSATGSLSAVVSVDVGSSVNGQLTAVYVGENQRVKKGQPVAKVDDLKYRNQLEQARYRADNALRILERQKQLFASGAVASQDLEKAQLDYDLALKDIEITAKEIADTNIVAPISGIVVGQPMPAGQTIGGANLQTIMTIADLTNMEVNALIDESDVGGLKVGQRATFTIDAFGRRTFTGTVELISYRVKTQQNVNYYNAVIRVDHTDAELRPGMTAHVSIVTDQRTSALLVPLRAIREKNNRQYVEVKNGSQTEEREITIGISDDEWAEVLGGLREDEEVVVAARKKTETRSPGHGPPGL